MANIGVEIGELLELPDAGRAHCAGQRDHEVGRRVNQFLIVPLLTHKSIINKQAVEDRVVVFKCIFIRCVSLIMAPVRQ